jgi:hypothetical protein
MHGLWRDVQGRKLGVPLTLVAASLASGARAGCGQECRRAEFDTFKQLSGLAARYDRLALTFRGDEAYRNLGLARHIRRQPLASNQQKGLSAGGAFRPPAPVTDALHPPGGPLDTGRSDTP